MEWPPNNIMHDEPLYIREIQNWLRALAFSDERLPLIAVDGIYGPETTQAVRAFQEITGLPATGTVDKATWDAVYIAFLAATGGDRNPPSSVIQFPSPDYVIMPGDQGDLVYAIQFMLDVLSRKFSNIPSPGVTGTHNESSQASVSALQHAFALPENGQVNKATWDSLITAYRVHQ